ncbi:hypothetical protein TIFTF001_031467 [Ficus carica]|uniref:Uncharacterized protein n=1 Tax=Ficus carica TaxID=3494 RepID=A0AA88J107_FICCA|nr:hypothetical protein TIFTF001_031467 [Ficus carica]
MSYFLCKSFLFGTFSLRYLPPISENANVFPQRKISCSWNQQSFTVSYLINSIGFSPETALSASKHVNLKTREKPDKLINLFEKYGFTQIQISKLVRGNPRLLLLDAEKTILPKLEFLVAKGISGPEMAKMLSAFPRILSASLAKQIMPSYDFFRGLFQSDVKLIAAVKRCPDILTYNVEKHVSVNIDILRKHGVPDSNIPTLLLHHPRSLMVSPDGFRKIVEEVEEMGFDASKVNFVMAANAFLSMSRSKWESKVDAYKKWGWSEEEVLKAFERNPRCMMVSEDKITAAMDFFVNKFGWRPCLIAKRPILLSLSLRKRLIPRSSVFQALLSKGLVKKEVNLAALFETSEQKFLQKFVLPYKKEAPELLKLYKEKLNLSNGLLVDQV